MMINYFPPFHECFCDIIKSLRETNKVTKGVVARA